ncbi:MAG: polysaccharide deacetylase family protein [Desulfobaccales bacterium]
MRRYLEVGGCLALVALLVIGAGLVRPVRGAQPAIIWAGEQERHAVAITFDDGPSPSCTPKILALLKQYQAHATFFVLGRKVEKYPGLIKIMLREGHEVGNHTFDHPRLTNTDQLAREHEIEKTGVDLDLVGCPQRNRLLRPPYSAFDKRLVSYLEHTHQQLVLWSLDSGDWRGLDAAAIVNNVLPCVKNGSIIIFHDSDEKDRADRRPTVESLKVILPALRAAGYQLVTISELVNPRKP